MKRKQSKMQVRYREMPDKSVQVCVKVGQRSPQVGFTKFRGESAKRISTFCILHKGVIYNFKNNTTREANG